MNSNNENFSKVACMDEVFLFVKKEIWQEYRFDEKIFKDFHFYDTDFSVAIAQKYQNYVYFEMDVYHLSPGYVEKTYCENMYLFQKKWRNRLPYCLPGYKFSFQGESRMANDMVSLYRKNGFSKIEIFKRIYKVNGILFFMYFLVKRIKNKFS